MHVLECVQKIYPVFNRAVIFQNTPVAYHGFPETLQCPDNITRKSIAVYYYTKSDEKALSRTGGRYFLRPSDAVSEEMVSYIENRAGGYIPLE